MGLAATIGMIVLLVSLRLLFPPMPMFAPLARRWGMRTSIVLCSVAGIAVVILIVVSRQH